MASAIPLGLTIAFLDLGGSRGRFAPNAPAKKSMMRDLSLGQRLVILLLEANRRNGKWR